MDYTVIDYFSGNETWIEGVRYIKGREFRNGVELRKAVVQENVDKIMRTERGYCLLVRGLEEDDEGDNG